MKINSITYEHVYRNDNKVADGKFQGKGKRKLHEIFPQKHIYDDCCCSYCFDRSTKMVFMLYCLPCCPHCIAIILFLHFKRNNECIYIYMCVCVCVCEFLIQALQMKQWMHNVVGVLSLTTMMTISDRSTWSLLYYQITFCIKKKFVRCRKMENHVQYSKIPKCAISLVFRWHRFVVRMTPVVH